MEAGRSTVGRSTRAKSARVPLFFPTLVILLRMGGLAISMFRLAGACFSWCLIFILSCFIPILNPYNQVSPQRTSMSRTSMAIPVAWRISMAEVAAGAALVSSSLVGLGDVAGAATPVGLVASAAIPVVAVGVGVVQEEIEAGAAV